MRSYLKLKYARNIIEFSDKTWVNNSLKGENNPHLFVLSTDGYIFEIIRPKPLNTECFFKKMINLKHLK